MASPNCLTAKNIQCFRGEKLLFNNINFTLSAGECLHVTGSNGSGKTSLLRILCGLNQCDKGLIQWNNQTLSHNEKYLTDSVYIGHKDALKNELSAIENLRFYQQLDGKISENNLDDALARMQILQCADLLTQQLSFGQRRRLAFARLLLKDFALWILDEPFTGIDKQGRALIDSLCVNHLSNGGMIVLTNHLSLINSAFSTQLTELAL